MAQEERDSANSALGERNSKDSYNKRADRPLFQPRKNGSRRYFDNVHGESAENALPFSKPRSGSSDWLSGNKTAGIKLSDAFKLAQGDGILAAGPQLSRADSKGFEVERLFSHGPTSRQKRYSIDAGSPSGSAAIDIGKDREERSSSVPVEYERVGAGSPSPGPRNNRLNRDGNTSDTSGSGASGITPASDIARKMMRIKRDEERKAGRNISEKEPPVMLPTTWGSRARSRKSGDWVGDIKASDSSPKIQAPLSPQEDPKTGVDMPLPSVGQVSLAQQPTPPASRPNSAQPNYLSQDESVAWDVDLDFTAQSLQMSTPHPKAKTSKLDEIRNKELQGFTARAVASNKLEEIKERNSEERSIIREPVQTKSREPIQREETIKPERKETPFHDITILDEEGEQIRGTPITIFSNSSYDNYNATPRPKSVKNNNEGVNAHSLDEPRQILRELSRATSSSPGPSSSVSAGGLPKPPAKETRDDAVKRSPENLAVRIREDKRHEIPETKRHSRASSTSKSDIDPEERIAAEKSLFELPDSKSERNSIREPTPSPPASDYGANEETPRPKPNPLSLPTPKVTGAYIDTPAASERQPRRGRSISPTIKSSTTSIDRPSRTDGIVAFRSERQQTERASIEAEKPEKSSEEIMPSVEQQRAKESNEKPLAEPIQPSKKPRPQLKNSAQPTTAAEDLRRLKQDLDLDDTTIDNLSAVLSGKEIAADDSVDLGLGINLEYDERGRPLSSKEKERRLDRLTLDRMNKRLLSTSSSIADARIGIERLEHQVASSKPEPPKAFQEAIKNEKHPPTETCSKCANSAKPDTSPLQISIPRLWVRQPPSQTRWRNWKFTRLGLLAFIFAAWYISESAMCAQFCHPKQSSVNTWKPSDPFFPWAIPTKLDQWSGELGSAAIEQLINMCGGDGERWRYVTPPWYYMYWQSLTADDWFDGRSGPVTLIGDETASIFNDEMI